jgi:hypothetical protein
MEIQKITEYGHIGCRGVWHTPWWMASIVVVGKRAYAIRPYERNFLYPNISSISINRLNDYPPLDADEDPEGRTAPPERKTMDLVANESVGFNRLRGSEPGN